MVGGPEPANYPERVSGGRRATWWCRAKANWRWKRSCAGRPLEQVPGICFPGVNTGPAQLLPDLDRQPWPDRERIDIDRYLRAWREHHGAGSVSVITARGCPYHCRWCSHSTFGKTHRRRSPLDVVDEVEWILEPLPAGHAVAGRRRLHHPPRLAGSNTRREMKRRGLRIPFECITRADRMNARVAGQLAELGCYPRLDRLGERIAAIAGCHGARRHAWRRCATPSGSSRRMAFETGMFLMWGYEGEELADIEATYEHVKACQPDVFFTTVSYPIKGTPYYDEVAPKLVQLGAWQDHHRPRDQDPRPAFAAVLSNRRPAAAESKRRRRRSSARESLKRRRARWKHEHGCLLFDRVAARYDELWTATPIGRAQRNPVWRDIDPLFQRRRPHSRYRLRHGRGCRSFHGAGHTGHAFGPVAPAMIEVAQARGRLHRQRAPRRRDRGVPAETHSTGPSPISAP